MSVITVEISDERLRLLQERATNLGITLEDLVLLGIDDLLAPPADNLQQTIDYVLAKNAELYRRLA